jgi:hypothetical protein
MITNACSLAGFVEQGQSVNRAWLKTSTEKRQPQQPMGIGGFLLHVKKEDRDLS